LKAPGAKIDVEGEQYRILQRLTDLGHPATWANSVYTFATMALSLGVPLQRNWQYVAQHEDELVAADIRKQEVRAEAKRNGTYKPAKPRAPRLTPRDRKAAGIYARSFL
jgi:hypothetical protein